jgi:hypothetical protein
VALRRGGLAGGQAQGIEYLPSMHKALSSNSSTAKKKKKKDRQFQKHEQMLIDRNNY